MVSSGLASRASEQVQIAHSTEIYDIITYIAHPSRTNMDHQGQRRPGLLLPSFCFPSSSLIAAADASTSMATNAVMVHHCSLHRTRLRCLAFAPAPSGRRSSTRITRVHACTTLTKAATPKSCKTSTVQRMNSWAAGMALEASQHPGTLLTVQPVHLQRPSSTHARALPVGARRVQYSWSMAARQGREAVRTALHATAPVATSCSCTAC